MNSGRIFMSAADLIDWIRDCEFAEGLPEPIVRRLTEMSRERRVPKGTVLFREGDVRDDFYLIHSGHIVLEMCLAGRGCTRLLTLGPGELLAWSSLVGDACMTANAMAQDDAVLIAMSGKELAAACDADPVLGYQVMRRLATGLSKRLFATRLQLLDMFIADAPAGQGGKP